MCTTRDAIAGARANPRISSHALERAYERFPRLRGFSRPYLRHHLEQMVPQTTHYADSYLVGQEFRMAELSDGTPLVMVVDHQRAGDVVITVLDVALAAGCGAARKS